MRDCHSNAEAELKKYFTAGGGTKPDQEVITKHYLASVRPCIEKNLRDLPALAARLDGTASSAGASGSRWW